MTYESGSCQKAHIVLLVELGSCNIHITDTWLRDLVLFTSVGCMRRFWWHNNSGGWTDDGATLLDYELAPYSEKWKIKVLSAYIPQKAVLSFLSHCSFPLSISFLAKRCNVLHVISRSGEVILITNCYIRFTLLYFTCLIRSNRSVVVGKSGRGDICHWVPAEGAKKGYNHFLWHEMYTNYVSSVEARMDMEGQIMCIEQCIF